MHLLFESACAFKDLEVPTQAFHVTATPEWYTDNRKRVDVLLVFRLNWSDPPFLVIGIEGKIKASESPEQLAQYQKAINEAFPEIPKGLVFLTRGGDEPTSADLKNRNCPVKQLSWASLCKAPKSLLGKSPFAQEFTDHIKGHLSPSTGAEAKQSCQFLENHLRPAIEGAFSPGRLKFAWANPNSAPDEFNFSDALIDKLTVGKNFQVFFMFYCPSGVPQPGSQMHLLVMAYKSPRFGRVLSARVDDMARFLPPREGGRFEWGPWKSLWSCGCVTLQDMGAKSTSDLLDMFKGAHSRIWKPLSSALKKI